MDASERREPDTSDMTTRCFDDIESPPHVGDDPKRGEIRPSKIPL